MAISTYRITGTSKSNGGLTPFFVVFLVIFITQLISYPLNIILPDSLYYFFEGRIGTFYFNLAYLLSVATFVVLLLGYMILPCKLWARQFQSKNAIGFTDKHLTVLYIISSLSILLLCLTAFVRMGFLIPLLMGHNVPGLEYSLLRFDATAAIGTEIIVACQYVFLPINSFAAFAISKQRLKFRLCSVLLYGLVSMFTLERSTMVIPVLVHLAAKISFKPPQFKILLKPIIISAMLSGTMIVFSMLQSIDRIETGFTLFLSRLIHGQWVGFPAYLWHFKDHPVKFSSILHPYLKSIFGFEKTFTPGKELMIEMYSYVSIWATGNIPSLFIGEAYAIGGWALAVFSIIHVLLFMTICTWMFTKLPKTPITCILYGIIAVKIAMGTVLGYSAFLITQLTLLVLIILFYVNIIQPEKSQKKPSEYRHARQIEL